MKEAIPEPASPVSAAATPDTASNAGVAMFAKLFYLTTRLMLPPLVLAHLSLAEYGLWSACFVLIMYIGLTDVGFSSVVSMGSSTDVDFGEILDYLVSDSNTRSILMYIEGIRNARSFMRALRAAARIKPVMLVKVGRHPAGSKAAMSHTASLVGADDVFDAAFSRVGVVRVQTVTQLFTAARALSFGFRPVGNRLAVVTNGGGPGVMAATPELAGRDGDVELRGQLAPEPLHCDADTALLGQVLVNLVTNAFQALEEASGPKRITVSVAREGGFAVVRVADTGPGVPGHLREKIFDTFFTTRRGGHGIGLSLCRRIVFKHGGRISAGSAEGGGAEFRVELPLAEERSRV